MSRYLANIPSGSPMNRKEALDMQIVQRVLTKVRGSREQIGYLTSLNEENKLIGRFPELLKKYRQVSAFTESLRVLERKAKELTTDTQKAIKKLLVENSEDGAGMLNENYSAKVYDQLEELLGMGE